MSERDRYGVVIVGAGQAGVPLAHALARGGRRVAIIERKHLGGSCVNFGCTPTKAAIASARVAHLARRARDFGISVPAVAVDFPAVLERARRMASESRASLERRFEGSENPELLRGHGRLEGREGTAFVLRIGDRTVVADQVVLDTGTRTAVPPIEGLDRISFLHSGNWLDRPELPERLAMIGGGSIGLEMAQFYRRMGSQVTILEGSERVLSHEDQEVSEAMQRILAEEGVEFLLEHSVTRIESQGGMVLMRVKAGAKEGELRVSHLFVAAGRKPNTDDLGLETVGLSIPKSGLVEVDERLATSVPGLWAAGDIRGGPMFTQTAWDDFRILQSQLAGDGSRTTRRIVPYAVFTDPELGRAGMTERQAREEGRACRVARFEMKRDAKAREMGETKGFIEVLIEDRTGHILGAAVLSVQGSELVHAYVDVMNAEAPYTVIENAIHIHPTLSESIQSALARGP